MSVSCSKELEPNSSSDSEKYHKIQHKKLKWQMFFPFLRHSRIMTIERLKRAVSILSCYGKIPVMDRDYSKNQA